MTGSSIVPPAGAAPDPIGPASDELRDLAIAAALAVGPDLRAAFGRTHQVASKANFHDLVTESDAAAEATIRRHLLSGTPDAAIVGEEGGLIGDGLVRWYVDPIDGTNNFASGIPFFCVSIGATVADRLVAGVVYDPIRDELFAASGGIATCNGEPILSRGAPGDAEATLITGFPSYEPWPQAPSGPGDLERLGEMIRSFRTLRRLGSAALGLAYVAAGRADVAFGISSSPWDVAAGAILVEAAGGTYRAVPRSASSDRTPWLSPGYLAHVADFDPARSCLADIASLDER